MTSPPLLALTLAALALAGCGQSPCPRRSQVHAQQVEKTKACRDITLAPISSESACEESVKKCIGPDLDILARVNDCLERLPTCEPGQDLAWLGQQEQCSRQTAAMSEPCRAALK